MSKVAFKATIFHNVKLEYYPGIIEAAGFGGFL